MAFKKWLAGWGVRRQGPRAARRRRSKTEGRARLGLEVLEKRIVPSFKFVTADTGSTTDPDGTQHTYSAIYAVDTTGSLHWYKDTHRNGDGIVNGVTTSFDAPNEGAVIGTGWGTLRQSLQWRW
jgi:hypothetical protein